MNLLAHLHLSTGLSAEETAGNVLADFLPNTLVPPANIRRGIQLHRGIDSFTDQHALVAEARDLISDPRRRLAGIIVDVAFDFTLCQKWGEHCDTELAQFIEEGYSIVQYGARELGDSAHRLTSRMRQNRWLESYSTLDGMALTFRRMTRRSDAVSKLRGAEEEISAQLPEFQAIFDQFYPELGDRVTSILAGQET
ncbi:MAG: ACP phosphodiesterase [Verrucomicrobiales bacterium]